MKHWFIFNIASLVLFFSNGSLGADHKCEPLWQSQRNELIDQISKSIELKLQKSLTSAYNKAGIAINPLSIEVSIVWKSTDNSSEVSQFYQIEIPNIVIQTSESDTQVFAVSFQRERYQEPTLKTDFLSLIMNTDSYSSYDSIGRQILTCRTHLIEDRNANEPIWPVPYIPVSNIFITNLKTNRVIDHFAIDIETILSGKISN